MDADAAFAAQLQLEEWQSLQQSATAGASGQPADSGSGGLGRGSTSYPGPAAAPDADSATGWVLPSSARTVLGNVCDPSLETIDPSPDARAMFLLFNQHLFHGKLDCCELRWSKTMTRCAGLCSYEGKGGLCSVRLSEPLLKLRPRSDLVNTLVHEMIHAWEFVAARRRDHDAHGKEFKRIAAIINGAVGTNVTVFHDFHDEVRQYQRHVWQCSGPCRAKPPYFGIVRRAMNRAPGPSDWWFAQHAADCGGSYTKVSEPDPKEKAKAAKRSQEERDRDKAQQEANKRAKGSKRLDHMFPVLESSSGSQAGAAGAGPRLSGGTVGSLASIGHSEQQRGSAVCGQSEGEEIVIEDDDDDDVYGQDNVGTGYGGSGWSGGHGSAGGAGAYTGHRDSDDHHHHYVDYDLDDDDDDEVVEVTDSGGAGSSSYRADGARGAGAFDPSHTAIGSRGAEASSAAAGQPHDRHRLTTGIQAPHRGSSRHDNDNDDDDDDDDDIVEVEPSTGAAQAGQPGTSSGAGAVHRPVTSPKHTTLVPSRPTLLRAGATSSNEHGASNNNPSLGLRLSSNNSSREGAGSSNHHHDAENNDGNDDDDSDDIILVSPTKPVARADPS